MNSHPVYTGKHPFNVKQLLLLLPLFVVASCGGGGSDNPTPTPTPLAEFSKSANLISNVAETMRESSASLGASVTALNSSITSYCNTVTASNEGDTTLRTAAQNAFKSAMTDIQRSSLQALGPALEDDRFLQLYSWPTTSYCGIDQKLAIDDTGLNLAVNRRGMDALEYLLFVQPATGHACPTGALPELGLADFNTLSNADRQKRRCDFMENVAADAAASATELANAWNPAIGNHVATMTGTTTPGKTLNEITDAMYFLREVTREFKLDRPLGGTLTNRPPTCGSGNLCAEDVESSYARISKENIRTNVLAFQELYWGGNSTAAVGYDDWLVEKGEGTLAAKLNTEITAILTALDNVDGSLFDAINTNSNNPVQAVLDATDVVSQTLRHQVFPALGLQVPQSLVSDTD